MRILGVAVTVIVLLGSASFSQTLSAFDTPNDHGQSIDLSWDFPDTIRGITGFILLRTTPARAHLDTVTMLPARARGYVDASEDLVNGTAYIYELMALRDGFPAVTAMSSPAIPKGQWYHTGKTVILIFALVFSFLVLIMIQRARAGQELYVRPIGGIDAVDEAIGRATEMGRPILFVPGISEASEVATIAAFTILGRVAKRTAEYQTRLVVPNIYATVMIICQEVVKSAYLNAGRPDTYNENDVFYVTSEQFPFTAAVNGLMLRERPATNFYLGKFYAESLILAETGFQAGSMQIAGTDELTQIPFFVAACDYTLMGEELYAASAYLSKDPLQLGTLKAQDLAKVIIVIILLLGIILTSFGTDIVSRLLAINL